MEKIKIKTKNEESLQDWNDLGQDFKNYIQDIETSTLLRSCRIRIFIII